MNRTVGNSHIDIRVETPEAETPVKAIGYPLRVAGIDIGSNAIRAQVVEFSTPQRYSPVMEERFPVRLGHGVFLHGKLDERAVQAAIEAMKSIREGFDRFSPVKYRAVATSAVREASNGRDFLDRIRAETGIDLDIITGSEEARLVHLAVKKRISLTNRQWILVDLGGGSVEVSLADDSGILWSESHTMGSVRLLEELSISADEPGRFQKLLEEYISTLKIPSVARYKKPSGMIGTGGNIDELARLAGCRPDRDGVSAMNPSDLRAVIDMLSRMSFRQRVESLGLKEDRADVILPAGMVYDRIAGLIEAKIILVPHVGVKEGILYDLVDELTTHDAREQRQEEQTLEGAVNLGRRYFFDEQHSVHVAGLAVSLFDQTREVHALGVSEKKYLIAAAVLHDVGAYISYKKHHKHSLYVISNSELPGFSEHEMLIIANIARYHRKSEPKNVHELFQALTRTEQETVVKLAALLRVADALDREHTQCVHNVTAQVERQSLVIELHGVGELRLERWALQKKDQLFDRAFGLKVRVR